MEGVCVWGGERQKEKGKEERELGGGGKKRMLQKGGRKVCVWGG